MRAVIALLLTVSGATAGPIDDAMKKIGPAYMCGPQYEYTEALAALRFELKKAGVTDILADYALAGVREAADANKAARDKITAAECAAKYGRTD